MSTSYHKSSTTHATMTPSRRAMFFSMLARSSGVSTKRNASQISNHEEYKAAKRLQSPKPQMCSTGRVQPSGRDVFFSMLALKSGVSPKQSSKPASFNTTSSRPASTQPPVRRRDMFSVMAGRSSGVAPGQQLAMPAQKSSSKPMVRRRDMLYALAGRSSGIAPTPVAKVETTEQHEDEAGQSTCQDVPAISITYAPTPYKHEEAVDHSVFPSGRTSLDSLSTIASTELTTPANEPCIIDQASSKLRRSPKIGLDISQLQAAVHEVALEAAPTVAVA